MPISVPLPSYEHLMKGRTRHLFEDKEDTVNLTEAMMPLRHKVKVRGHTLTQFIAELQSYKVHNH